jgi:hypothetical protein
MPWTIADQFKIFENKAVVDFILRDETLSAHGDVAEVLTRSAQGLSDVKTYCPDLQNYAYMVLHTSKNKIFGIAFSQSGLAYRLPKERLKKAVAAGGTIFTEIGDDWVVFNPWQSSQPVTVSQWCKIAHDHAAGPIL